MHFSVCPANLSLLQDAATRAAFSFQQLYNSSMDQSVAVINFAALRRQPVRVWLPQVLLLAYLALVLLAFVALPVLAFNWLSVPYPGLLTGPALRIHAVPGEPAAGSQALHPGDRLTAINGTALQSAQDLNAALRKLKAGDSATLQRAARGRANGGDKPDAGGAHAAQPAAGLHLRAFPGRSDIPGQRGVDVSPCGGRAFPGACWRFSPPRWRWYWPGCQTCLPARYSPGCGFWRLAWPAAAAFSMAFLFPREDALIHRYPAPAHSRFYPRLAPGARFPG